MRKRAHRGACTAGANHVSTSSCVSENAVPENNINTSFMHMESEKPTVEKNAACKCGSRVGSNKSESTGSRPLTGYTLTQQRGKYPVAKELHEGNTCCCGKGCLLSGALLNLSQAFGRVGIIRALGSGATTVDGVQVAKCGDSLATHAVLARKFASDTA
jgi:hypothetical protein